MTLNINENGIDRKMTDDEIEAHEITQSQLASDMAQLNDKLEAIASAKQSAKNKLKALGLSDAEVSALVG